MSYNFLVFADKKQGRSPVRKIGLFNRHSFSEGGYHFIILSLHHSIASSFYRFITPSPHHLIVSPHCKTTSRSVIILRMLMSA